VANGPANISDWIGLCPVAGGDKTCQTPWSYLNGLKTRPAAGIANATLQLTAPAEPGYYNVRWFANDGWTKLATSALVTVTSGPALTINDVTVIEGDSGTVSATFTVTLSPTNDTQTVTVDYATANGTATTANGDYASASGTLTFAPGTATRTFTVAIIEDTTFEPDETFVVNLSNAVNAILRDSQAIGAILNDDADPVPGPKVRLPSPSLRVDVGETIPFTITDGPGNISDWVGLCPAGGADTSCLMAWSYLNGLKTRPSSGITNATLGFTAPATAGSYDVRLFASDGWTKLATSGTVSVTVPTPIVSVDESPVSAGGVIYVGVANGPANVGDWVGLYQVDASNSNLIAWSYLNGQHTRPGTGLSFAAPLEFTAPVTPGAYEVRLFSNDGYTLLATSAPITVQ